MAKSRSRPITTTPKGRPTRRRSGGPRRRRAFGPALQWTIAVLVLLAALLVLILAVDGRFGDSAAQVVGAVGSGATSQPM